MILKYKFFISLFILLNLFAFELKAQVIQEWIKNYNGSGNNNDVANAIAVDDSGNVYITGYSTVNGARKITTIKYNSAGTEQWVAVYNNPGSYQFGDEGLDIAVDNSGNVYVTGSSAAGASENTLDYVTIKYNSAGDQLWAERYNSQGNGQDIAFAIALDEQGNVFVTGQSGHPALNSNIATIKYNTSGDLQWIAEFDGTGNRDTGKDLVVDNLGNVYVTGLYSTDWGTAYLDFITLKYNPQGIQQWVKEYNGSGQNSDEAVAIDLDASGNIYVTGFATGSGTVYDIATFKFNPSGDILWTRIFSSSSPSIDVPADLKVDENGNVYIAAAVSFNYGTLKYDTDGNLQWMRTYDYNGNFDFARSLAIDGTGNIYVTGVSGKAQTEVSNDYATVKYNSAGDQLWVQRFDGPSANWDEATSVAVDGQGNVFVTGYSNSSNYNMVTIKYVQEPIPVELISFNGYLYNNKIILEWITASEINNFGFDVERKALLKPAEGMTFGGWERIGFVEGYGTTSETKSYSFVDNQIGSGTYSYRLKQIDFDGNFKYSNTIEVKVITPNEFYLAQNYPNPFNSSTVIRFTMNKETKAELKVFDLLGNEITSLFDDITEAGKLYELKFDASSLSSGIYYYKLTDDDKTEIKKMILLK